MIANILEPIGLLDHGFIRLIEAWGSDESIVEAARMSTGKGFLGWGPKGWECRSSRNGKGVCGWRTDGGHPGDIECPKCGDKGFSQIQGDEKLLRYLYENKHATPFEMAGLVLEVQAPIFVFREWHRHRTQSYNEMSARYAPLPNVNYVPTVKRLLLGRDATNKQAGALAGASTLTPEEAERFRRQLTVHYDQAETIYQSALSAGVPKELARVHLPVGRYSRMRASANLRNWLAFLTLRTASAAQWEIRQYALVLSAFVENVFPRTHALLGEAPVL